MVGVEMSLAPLQFTVEDAHKLLVDFARKPDHGQYGSYGYDLYLSTALRVRLERQGLPHFEVDAKIAPYMPALYAAAWDLCRRGILRPGINAYRAQATDSGGSGEGYSITPFGRQWLNEADKDDFVPTEPERFAQMFKPHQQKFGAGFYERSQEAIRCYGAHAYLACSAMCGAAAEAILLATAIAKGDEAAVLAEYSSSGGRRKVENRITGQARQDLKAEFLSYTSLLKYWRDQAAHGKPARIGDHEAYTSLAMLLRFANYTSDNWSELTKATAQAKSIP